MTTSHGGVSSTEMVAVNKRGKKTQKSLPAVHVKNEKNEQTLLLLQNILWHRLSPRNGNTEKSNEPHRTGTTRKKETLLKHVVLTLTRIIIKSVVTGQAPVTLELRNAPGEKTKGGTRIDYITVDAIHASIRNI